MGAFDTIYSVFVIFVFLVIGISLIYEKKAHISPSPVLPHVRLKALTLLPSQFTANGRIKSKACLSPFRFFSMSLNKKNPALQRGFV